MAKDLFNLKQVQMVTGLTLPEDAADVPTNTKFFNEFGGLGAAHHFFI